MVRTAVDTASGSSDVSDGKEVEDAEEESASSAEEGLTRSFDEATLIGASLALSSLLVPISASPS